MDQLGAGVDIDPAKEGTGQFEVEWLAGGCVMHYKKIWYWKIIILFRARHILRIWFIPFVSAKGELF